jgi:hypothetical protein
VVLSAAALWLCYFVLVSIRWALVGHPIPICRSDRAAGAARW